MRARKRVLLYCADEAILSPIAFVLEVRCLLLAVTKTCDPKGFLDASLAEGVKFDCVVVVRTEKHLLDDRQVLALLSGEDAGRLTVEVMNGLPLIHESCAQKRIHGPIGSYGAGMADIVEQVRLACKRKRGPKGTPQPEEQFSLASIGRAPAAAVVTVAA